MLEDVLYTTVQQLERIGVSATFNFKSSRDFIGADLHIESDNQKYKFEVIYKPNLRMHSIPKIIDTYLDHPFTLIAADEIYPEIKKELIANKISHIDGNGNSYINAPLFIVVLSGNKTIKRKQKGNRAFTKTGLKVLFHFLMDKELINKTHRNIAEETGVGLGNIPQIITGLKETGFILPLNNKEYIWENRESLLFRWITDYATILKPKITKGQYHLREPWGEIKFENGETVWGGEPAADLLTNHLRPEKFTIYTHQTQVELISKYKLIPAVDGTVTVYEKFWESHNKKKTKTAPPILVYADLIIEGGKRNTETAKLIYNEFIKPIL